MLAQRLYFIQCGNRGPIKIGISGSPSWRLASLQGASPYKLRLLCDMPGNRHLEESVHRKFSSCRIRGEWFRPLPELVAVIKAAANDGGAGLTESLGFCKTPATDQRQGAVDMTDPEFARLVRAETFLAGLAPPPEFTRRASAVLRAWRDREQLSQADVARLLGNCLESSVSHWELDRSAPSLQCAIALDEASDGVVRTAWWCRDGGAGIDAAIRARAMVAIAAERAA